MCRLLNLEIEVNADEVNFDEEKFFSDEKELVEDYLCMLQMNGQIYSDYSAVCEGGHKFRAFVNVPERESLDARYNNDYDNRSYRYMTVKITDMGDNFLYEENCRCKEVPYYILEGSFDAGTSSPVICGRCGNEVPLYKLPRLYSEEDHFSLISFNKCFAGVHELFVQSLSDRFTKNQLSNPRSSLNKAAFAVREELEKKLDKPVYVNLTKIYDLSSRRAASADQDKCPLCGKTLSECTFQIGLVRMFKCEDCRLITDKI